MRQIKFRGKRKDNGEWAKGFYFIRSPVMTCIKSEREESSHFIITESGGDWGLHKNMDFVEVDPATVGQFTGLLDKNGKEIYEGDIIEVGKCPKPVKVFCGVGAWLVDCPHYQGSTQFLTQYANEIHNIAKVIGNIHDNPELLEKAK